MLAIYAAGGNAPRGRRGSQRSARGSGSNNSQRQPQQRRGGGRHPPRRQPEPLQPQRTAQADGPPGAEDAARPAADADGRPAAADAATPPAAAARPAAARPAAVRLPPRRPEVLAPAGGWPQLRAAVECGADAVYFGLTDFNARARAANFAPEELPAVMRYLHERGVKGYAVLNVLVFDEELPAVQQRARQMAQAGVDAVIVQDLGAVALLREVAPGLPVHGSTQMTITSAEGAEFARRLGVERVVVGRELSVRDIGAVAAGSPAVEVEAFVHGALCVSYSGQCFSSEAWGGRSANRGRCAQACRVPYGLVVDGALRALGDVAYLLSPQDLAAVELVPELVQAGVGCFKIEGRLKGPEYVAATVSLYRRAVDAAWDALQASAAGSGGDAGAGANAGGAAGAGAAADEAIGGAAAAGEAAAAAAEAGRLRPSAAEWRDLALTFARGQDGEHGGLTPGFLEGSRHQRLVRGRNPRHRGALLGTVERASRDGVAVRLRTALRRGCGVVFDGGGAQAGEQGGAVYGLADAAGRSLEAAEAGEVVTLEFRRDDVDPAAVRPGQLAWLTKDPALEARLRGSYEGLAAAAQRRLPVSVAVAAALGAPLRVTLTDGEGRAGSGESDAFVAPAAGAGLSEGELRRAVGRHLGGDAPLAAAAWDLAACDLPARLFLPAAEIKAARRRAVAALLAARAAAQAAAAAGLRTDDALGAMLARVRQAGAPRAEGRLPADAAGPAGGGAGGAEPAGGGGGGEEEGGAPVLRVLCRSKGQVDAALALPWLSEVVLDFLEVHGLKEACAAVRAAGRRLVVATPRVLKPGEQRLLAFYLRLGADALLLRSAGVLHQLMEAGGPGARVAGCEHAVPLLEGDFSLNAANALSADLLLRAGLSRLAPTHDLNAEQLAALARGLGTRAARLEVVTHQHLPIFHTEHCVFCRFLSDGSDWRDCGHPCESATVHLRDEKGQDHLVLADQGCRNTVFNAQAQSGAPFLGAWAAAGVGCLRVELVDEAPAAVAPLLQGYRAALRAAAAGDARAARQQAQKLWRWLGELPDANGRAHGVALGSLEARQEQAPELLKPTAASLK